MKSFIFGLWLAGVLFHHKAQALETTEVKHLTAMYVAASTIDSSVFIMDEFGAIVEVRNGRLTEWPVAFGLKNRSRGIDLTVTEDGTLLRLTNDGRLFISKPGKADYEIKADGLVGIQRLSSGRIIARSGTGLLKILSRDLKEWVVPSLPSTRVLSLSSVDGSDIVLVEGGYVVALALDEEISIDTIASGAGSDVFDIVTNEFRTEFALKRINPQGLLDVFWARGDRDLSVWARIATIRNGAIVFANDTSLVVAHEKGVSRFVSGVVVQQISDPLKREVVDLYTVGAVVSEDFILSFGADGMIVQYSPFVKIHSFLPMRLTTSGLYSASQNPNEGICLWNENGRAYATASGPVAIAPIEGFGQCTLSGTLGRVSWITDTSLYFHWESSGNNTRVELPSNVVTCVSGYKPQYLTVDSLGFGFGYQSDTRMITTSSDGWKTFDTLYRLDARFFNGSSVRTMIRDKEKHFIIGVDTLKLSQKYYKPRQVFVAEVYSDSIRVVEFFPELYAINRAVFHNNKILLVAFQNTIAEKGRTTVVEYDRTDRSIRTILQGTSANNIIVLDATYLRDDIIIPLLDGRILRIDGNTLQQEQIDIDLPFENLVHRFVVPIDSQSVLFSSHSPIAWASIVRFTDSTTTTVDQDDPYLGLRAVDILKVFPIPASNKITIEGVVASGLESAGLRYTMSDIIGVVRSQGEVADYLEKPFENGAFQFTLPTKNLENGAYVIALSLRSSIVSRTFTVVR